MVMSNIYVTIYQIRQDMQRGTDLPPNFPKGRFPFRF